MFAEVQPDKLIVISGPLVSMHLSLHPGLLTLVALLGGCSLLQAGKLYAPESFGFVAVAPDIRGRGQRSARAFRATLAVFGGRQYSSSEPRGTAHLQIPASVARRRSTI